LTTTLDKIERGQVLNESGTPHDWGTWFWADDYNPDNSVIRVMPEGTSLLRARAIMKKLDQAGLISGCHCGCRGEYQLTFLGTTLLRTIMK
jgi:hypothetical protein